MRWRRPTVTWGDASLKIDSLFALDEFALRIAAGPLLGRWGCLWRTFNELALGILAGGGESRA